MFHETLGGELVRGCVRCKVVRARSRLERWNREAKRVRFFATGTKWEIRVRMCERTSVRRVCRYVGHGEQRKRDTGSTNESHAKDTNRLFFFPIFFLSRRIARAIFSLTIFGQILFSIFRCSWRIGNRSVLMMRVQKFLLAVRSARCCCWWSKMREWWRWLLIHGFSLIHGERPTEAGGGGGQGSQKLAACCCFFCWCSSGAALVCVQIAHFFCFFVFIFRSLSLK